MLKSKPCKNCGSIWHTAWAHKQTKPMRHESKKAQDKRLATREKWFEENPPDANGNWKCYIPKHPLCPRLLDHKTIRLEHDLSKARRPDLIYETSNIHPACDYDNKAKGSLSAAEYMQK